MLGFRYWNLSSISKAKLKTINNEEEIDNNLHRFISLSLSLPESSIAGFL
jgi:hypothetical protein